MGARESIFGNPFFAKDAGMLHNDEENDQNLAKVIQKFRNYDLEFDNSYKKLENDLQFYEYGNYVFPGIALLVELVNLGWEVCNRFTFLK